MVGRFPFNSCETASLLFGKLIKYLYTSKDVFFVVGACKNGGGDHFWIEVDGLCYDITADQFESVNAPFYGVSLDQHAAYFLKKSKIDIGIKFLENYFYTSKVEQFASAIRSITSNSR